jgi:type VI secretion system protein ImpF
MAERAATELLQPALLDRLSDTVRLIDQELARLRRLVLPELDTAQRAALAKLIDPERRPIRPPTEAELAELGQLEAGSRELLLSLIEHEHRHQLELGQRQLLSQDRLKRLVLRDLERLFNTDRLDSRPLPGEGPANHPTSGLEENFPHVAASVVNYGIPPLAGKVGHNIDIARLEEEVAKAIHRFEPRLSAASLEVRALLDPEAMRHNTLAFEIEAELWALPVPLRLRLRTQIDLESGAARVLEQAA